MWKHHLYFINFLIFIIFDLGAQPNNIQVKDYIPPSPNSSALFKFTDIPVSLFTGTPNISIPLAEISDGPLHMPVSISYHASGLKVAETAGWVGAGWALNAGGTIHRQVQGKPDEQGYYYDRIPLEGLSQHIIGLEPYFTDLNLASQQVANLAMAQIDGEPDIFSFNFLGYSGKFLYNKLGEIELIPKQNLKIQTFFQNSSLISILIIDDKGTQYFFGSVPSQYNNLPGNIVGNAYGKETTLDVPFPLSNFDFVPVSEFHLVKIVSHDNLYCLDFYYTSERFSYKTKASEFYKSTTNCYPHNTDLQRETGGQEESELKGSYNLIHSETPKITKIVSNSNKDSIAFISNNIRQDIDYNGTLNAKSLDNIKYYTNDVTHCKEIQFEYKYYTDNQNPTRSEYKKLKLTTIQEKSCNQTVLTPPYKFYYEGESSQNSNSFFPNRFSKAVDHWGYYNGQSANDYASNTTINVPQTIIPGTVNQTIGSANRNASGILGKTGILSKILYPTGGSQVMEFEGHQILNYTNTVKLVDLQNCLESTSAACCGTNNQISGIITLDPNTPLESYKYYFTVERIYNPSNTPVHQNLCLPEQDVNVDVAVYLVNPNGSEAYLGLISYNHSILSETHYTSPIFSLPEFSNLFVFQQGQKYRFQMSVNNGRARFVIQNQELGVIEDVGGLRIKQIKTYVNDGINSSGDLTKNFDYKFSSNNKGSGFLISKPKYGILFQSIPNFISQIGVATCNKIIIADNTIYPLSNFNGKHIGYQEVKETTINNGYKIYKYNVEQIEFVSNAFYSPPVRYQAEDGLEYNSLTKDQTNNQIQEVNTTFDGYSPMIPGIFYRVYSERTINVNYLIFPYMLNTGYIEPKEIVTAYDNVTTTKTNVFTNPSSPYRLLNSTTTTNSDNKTYTTTYKYPFDLTTGTLRTELLNRNILTPLEEINTAGSTIISGTKTEWSFFNSSGNPTSTATQWLYPFKHYSIETTWNASNQPVYTGGAAGTWILKGTVDKINTLVGRPSEFTMVGWDKEYFNWNNTTKQLTSKQYGNFTWNYEYYPNSKLIKKITDIDGQFIDYEYDPLVRLKKITERGGNRVTDFTYYYRLNGGSGTQNYVEKTTSFTASANSSLTQLKDREFFDGLGRTIQTVKVGYSPTNKDVITAVKYDNIGRPFKKYEAYESINSNGTYYEIPDAAPHTLTTYEASPFNRPLTVTPPSWYATTMTYGANTLADGVKYAANLTTDYAINTLSKETMIDPNGNKTITFKDKLGRQVLTRKRNANDTETADTYTEYDDKGRVSKVYPPAASTSTPGLIFSYLYDGEDKVTWKKVPDMDGVNMQYNTKDLPAATWLPRENKWFLSNYDAYGRPVSTGLTANATLPSNLDVMSISDIMSQTIYDGVSGLGVPRTATAIDKGKVTTEQVKILGPNTFRTSTNIYDTYGRIGTRRANNHLNLAAISTTSSPETWSYTYDLADNLTSETRVHTAPGHSRTVTSTNVFNNKGLLQNIYFNGGTGETNKLISTMNYTHKNQLLSKLIGIDNTLQKLDYTYNNQGWLTSINPALPVPSSFVQYPVTMPTGTGNSTTDLFHMSLQYDDPATNVGTPTAIQKNGNIAQIQYQTIGREKEYWSYNYDYLDRLKNASHTRMSSNGAASIGQYSENITYDGPRGNIASIKRYGVQATQVSGNYTTLQSGLIDDLSMIYQAGTNRLSTVTDNGHTEFKHLGFNQLTGSGSTAHSYDASGNMTYDHSKRATIDYNHLNLPKSIIFQNGNRIDYTYDASGKKLTSTRSTNSTTIDKQHYLDGIEYKDISGSYRLEAIYHPEGRIYNTNVTNTATTAIVLRHELCIKDHLGNTRLTFYDRPSGQGGAVGQIEVPAEILQENHFYPFGMSMEGTWMNDLTANDKPYQYNGKELESFGGLGWYDYGARYYDACLGRFTGVDPLSSKGPQYSPYSYSFNNPIKFIDPDGRWPYPATNFVLKEAFKAGYNWVKNNVDLKASVKITFGPQIGIKTNAVSLNAKYTLDIASVEVSSQKGVKGDYIKKNNEVKSTKGASAVVGIDLKTSDPVGIGVSIEASDTEVVKENCNRCNTIKDRKEKLSYILPGNRIEKSGYSEGSSIKDNLDNTGAEAGFEINAFLIGVEVKGGVDINTKKKKDE